ncbi:MAG: ferrous iron transport protein A [Clostridia bacterium]|nr:ferrous iron transport protein A [Clostridia bacterium]
MEKKKTLAQLEVGETGLVIGLGGRGGVRRRMLDLGLTEGTRVSCIGRSPLGDPSAYLVRDKMIAIRKEDAEDIILKI